MQKIHINQVTKIFGQQTDKAQKMVKAGASKSEIFSETGCTVGLRNVSLEIPEGQIFVIMGLSGSGKSTLIRHVNRLIEPTEGEILVDGEDVLQKNEEALRDFRRNNISMVFQHFGLLPHKTVLENVGYGLKIRGLSKEAVRSEAEKWIDTVGLNGYNDVRPGQLSGGMRQRVGLARAFATNPDILLMDEPLGALDPLIRRDMQDQLLEIQSNLKKTVLFITHDLDEALKLGNQIAIIKDGEVIQVDTPEDLILNPATDYVRSFTRDINRGKFVKASSIMVKEEGIDPGSHIVVDSSTTLSDLLPLVFKDNSDHILVADEGVMCGKINKRTLMATFNDSSVN